MFKLCFKSLNFKFSVTWAVSNSILLLCLNVCKITAFYTHFDTCFSLFYLSQMDNQIVVSDYAQMDRVLREERAYILNLVKQIKKAGCNVLLIQKSILRFVNTRAPLELCGKLRPNTGTLGRVTVAVPVESSSTVCILSLMASLLCTLKNLSTGTWFLPSCFQGCSQWPGPPFSEQS